VEDLVSSLTEQTLVERLRAHEADAVRLVSGVLSATPGEYAKEAAGFLGIPAESPSRAAQGLAAAAVEALCCPESMAGEMSGNIVALLRSRNVVVKDTLASTCILPLWAVTIILAGSSRMSDPRKYFYSSLHRGMWTVREPLPRLANALASVGTPPPGQRVFDSALGNPNEVTTETSETLEIVLEVLAAYYQEIPAEVNL